MAVREPSKFLQIQKHQFSRVITKQCRYKSSRTFLAIVWHPLEIIVLRDNELHVSNPCLAVRAMLQYVMPGAVQSLHTEDPTPVSFSQVLEFRKTAKVTSNIPVCDVFCLKKHGLHLSALTTEGQLYTLPLPTSKKKHNRKESDVPATQIFTDLLEDKSENFKPYYELKLQDGDLIEQKDGAATFFLSQESVTICSKDDLGWQLETGKDASKSISIQDKISRTVISLQLNDFTFPTKPVMIEVNTPESSPKNALDDTLFSGLFGMEQNLSAGAITILALPNGTVYWTHLASCHPIQILYCLDEPVVDIHTMNITSKSNADNCLVIVGQEGKVVLITVDAKDKIVYDVTLIHNPVLASAVCDKRLVHSTGKAVCITDIGAIFERCTDEKTAKQGAQSACKIGAFCNVFGFVISDQQVAGDSGGVEIMAVTKLGRVMPLQIKSSVHHSTHSPGDVKDKLTAIHTLTQAVQDVEEKMCGKDRILQQLSLASLLSTHPRNPPLVVHHEIAVTNMGSHQQHVLNIKVQNQSPIALNQSWTIGIILQSCVFESQTIVYSRNLPTNFPPKAWELVSIPVTEEMVSMLPMKVTVTLAFTFPHAETTKSVSVVVLKEVLDMLNFLVPHASSGNEMVERRGAISLEQQVLSLAKQRPCHMHHQPSSKADIATKWFEINLPLHGMNTKSLSTMLADCSGLLPGLSSTIKAHTPEGSVCNLVVQKDAITVAATSLRTLYHIVHGLERRMLATGHVNSSAGSVSSVTKLLKQYQELQHDLAASSHTSEDMFAIYSKLRSFGLPQ